MDVCSCGRTFYISKNYAGNKPLHVCPTCRVAAVALVVVAEAEVEATAIAAEAETAVAAVATMPDNATGTGTETGTGTDRITTRVHPWSGGLNHGRRRW